MHRLLGAIKEEQPMIGWREEKNWNYTGFSP